MFQNDTQEQLPQEDQFQADFAPDLPRTTLVTPTTRRKPLTVGRLNDWHYVEHSMMRLLAAWGRRHDTWSDKVACHRHVWETAECVQQVRKRLSEFPGTVGNLDAPVSPALEELVNTVLLAPSFEDAIDGTYSVLMRALCVSYQEYGGTSHSVHDAPTLSTLHIVLGYKNGMRLWHRDYRRRRPHTIDASYAAKIESALAKCFDLKSAVPLDNGSEGALPCGVRTSFRQSARCGAIPGTQPRFNFDPFILANFETNIETRRFFWAYAYMLEMTLAEEMLRWVWAAHFMPWDYQYELTRHLWDESRHGDSGYSRLADFDIDLREVGYPRFGFDTHGPNDESGEIEGIDMMTPKELFEQAYFIGMIAETGHFTVKNESYADFRDGGDMESAEMMLFDVIDEGNHVRYCHEWLPHLATAAGLDLGDYRARAMQEREKYQTETDARAELARQNPILHDENDPSYQQFHRLIGIMREKHPLSNRETCPPRSSKPM